MKEDNLKHFTSEQDHDEAVTNGRKGGIASGEARRERARIRKYLDQTTDDDGHTFGDDIVIQLIAVASGRAAGNSTQAAITIYKMLGEWSDDAKAAKQMSPAEYLAKVRKQREAEEKALIDVFGKPKEKQDGNDLLKFFADGGRL